MIYSSSSGASSDISLSSYYFPIVKMNLHSKSGLKCVDMMPFVQTVLILILYIYDKSGVKGSRANFKMEPMNYLKSLNYILLKQYFLPIFDVNVNLLKIMSDVHLEFVKHLRSLLTVGENFITCSIKFIKSSGVTFDQGQQAMQSQKESGYLFLKSCHFRNFFHSFEYFLIDVYLYYCYTRAVICQNLYSCHLPSISFEQFLNSQIESKELMVNMIQYDFSSILNVIEMKCSKISSVK